MSLPSWSVEVVVIEKLDRDPPLTVMSPTTKSLVGSLAVKVMVRGLSLVDAPSATEVPPPFLPVIAIVGPDTSLSKIVLKV